MQAKGLHYTSKKKKADEQVSLIVHMFRSPNEYIKSGTFIKGF